MKGKILMIAKSHNFRLFIHFFTETLTVNLFTVRGFFCHVYIKGEKIMLSKIHPKNIF